MGVKLMQVLFYLMYKSSYVPRSVLVDWIYQKCPAEVFVLGVSSMYNVIINYLNFFLSCPIRNLTLSSLSRLFTIKIDVFSVLQVLIPTVVFSMKPITKN